MKHEAKYWIPTICSWASSSSAAKPISVDFLSVSLKVATHVAVPLLACDFAE